MTPDYIIRMAHEAGFESHDISLNFPKEIERFAALVAEAERERLFNELLKMHEKAKHSHNAYLHAVVTLREKEKNEQN